jgi:hypothetical protein
MEEERTTIDILDEILDELKAINELLEWNHSNHEAMRNDVGEILANVEANHGDD